MRKNIILLCLFLGLFAVSCSNSKVADQSEKEGMAAIERVREKIQEEEKIKEEEQVEKQEQVQEQEKKAEVGAAGNSSISPEDAVSQYVKEKKKQEEESRKKPQTEIDKLRETQKLANEKVNFYERVVRSVAREEKDILKHKENMSRLK